MPYKTMKKCTTLMLLALSSLAGHAQEWIDVTDAYVINPRFDNNDRTTGWMGTQYGAVNPMENAEFYEKYYNTYQQIFGLTPGKYRLSLDAFYRIGSASNDYALFTSGDYVNNQHAKLYAYSPEFGNFEVSIVPASSAALDSSLGGGVSGVGSGGWWGGGAPYIPNNMEAAHYWFEAGYYDNSVECEVGSDGVLEIGIYKETVLGADWTSYCV